MRTVCLLVKVKILSLLRVWGLSSGWFRAWLPAGCGFCGLRGGSTICIAERERPSIELTQRPLSSSSLSSATSVRKTSNMKTIWRYTLAKHTIAQIQKRWERGQLSNQHRGASLPIMTIRPEMESEDRCFEQDGRRKRTRMQNISTHVRSPGEAVFVFATLDCSPKLSKLSRSTVVCKKHCRLKMAPMLIFSNCKPKIFCFIHFSNYSHTLIIYHYLIPKILCRYSLDEGEWRHRQKSKDLKDIFETQG